MSDETVTCPGCGGDIDGLVLYDHADSGDAGDVDNVEDAEACSECYENSDCPDRCNEPHPEPEQDSEWACPTTGSRYRWCDECCEWQPMHRYDSPSVEVNGTLLCDPYEHGMTSCGACGEWMDSDYAYYSEYNDETYCEYCYREHGEGHVEADWSTRGRCNHCHGSLRGTIFFDPDSEWAFCSEEHAEGREVTILEAA